MEGCEEPQGVIDVSVSAALGQDRKVAAIAIIIIHGGTGQTFGSDSKIKSTIFDNFYKDDGVRHLNKWCTPSK